ncbi:cytochrome P450 [Trametes coccinea BRFM310]|uniref:Cytochrome P450 n=1 Tax=Trametes coccinea (strain BRFM310) TaxID=1353009 RepID=A0A1Y2J228_TRAC3|nr:cytochrome P450 [Trametes coccinea BRFM310]
MFGCSPVSSNMLVTHNTWEVITHSCGLFSFGIILASSVALLVYVRSLAIWRSRSRGLPLPPGPTPLPFVGNILDVGRWDNQWTGFKSLCSQYGDMVYLNILGRHVLIAGSPRSVAELLDKRSSNTSDRPDSPTIPLTGNDAALSTMPYGQWWRDHRRAFWQIFQPRVIERYRDAQRASVRKLLCKVLSSPTKLQEHLRYAFAATMIKILYGIDAKDEDDEHVQLIDEALARSIEIMTGGHLIDFLPWLQYLPRWVPGTGFRRELDKCKAAIDDTKEVPFAKMKATLESADKSALATLLLRAGDNTDMTSKAHYEEIIKNVGLVAIEGGSDTSFSTLLGLFVAMSLYPDVQNKAQAELDAVVGRHRLPDFEDQDSLVYIKAIVKEVLRWHTALPLSLPHRTLEDDEVDGYFIPAGTTIIPNTWAMLHDPEVYEEPERFMPERFIRDGKLDLSVGDPAVYAFGYGRRQVDRKLRILPILVCAGRHFADETLFLSIASILHILRIEPPLDKQGNPIIVEYGHTSGLVSYPRDIRCTIKPRFEEARSLCSDQ